MGMATFLRKFSFANLNSFSPDNSMTCWRCSKLEENLQILIIYFWETMLIEVCPPRGS